MKRQYPRFFVEVVPGFISFKDVKLLRINYRGSCVTAVFSDGRMREFKLDDEEMLDRYVNEGKLREVYAEEVALMGFLI